MLAARRWACSGLSPRISRLGRLPPCRALPPLHPQAAHCRPRTLSDDSDSGDKRRDLYLEQRRKLDSNLGNLGWFTGWFRKMKMRMVLVYILDQNPTFDIVRPLSPIPPPRRPPPALAAALSPATQSAESCPSSVPDLRP